MRLFPRAARRRQLAACAVAVVALGGAAVPLAHADDPSLEDRQQQVEKKIDRADRALEESSGRLVERTRALEAARAELVSAKGALASARTRLQAAQVRDREMQAALDAAEERLATARTDLATGQAALEEQRVELTSTVTSIYEQGDPQLLAFASILQAETPADLTRRMELRDSIVGREAGTYDDLHAAEVLLQVREDQVEEARQEVAAQRRAAAEHLTVMEDLHEETRAAKAAVAATVLTRRDAREKAAKARAYDRILLGRLKKEEASIKARILEQARREAARGQGWTGDAGGFLERPVPGNLTSPFGYRIHPIYGYWGLHDGADYGVSCGEGMKAAAAGTVISRYYSSVYGNRLYVNVGRVNGKALTLVYNHASGYRVGVGDRVRQGEVVGYVGSTGWSTGCHLHFTVLVNGNPVDPEKWM